MVDNLDRIGERSSWILELANFRLYLRRGTKAMFLSNVKSRYFTSNTV